MTGNAKDEILQDHNHDGIDRLGFLKSSQSPAKDNRSSPSIPPNVRNATSAARSPDAGHLGGFLSGVNGSG